MRNNLLHAFATFWTRDPTMLVIGVALWLFYCAIALLIGALSAEPVAGLTVFHESPLRDGGWAAILAVSALGLASSVLLLRAVIIRGLIALCAGLVSMFAGMNFVAGALLLHGFSASGAWSITAGLGLLAAASQWVHQGQKEPDDG